MSLQFPPRRDLGGGGHLVCFGVLAGRAYEVRQAGAGGLGLVICGAVAGGRRMRGCRWRCVGGGRRMGGRVLLGRGHRGRRGLRRREPGGGGRGQAAGDDAFDRWSPRREHRARWCARRSANGKRHGRAVEEDRRDRALISRSEGHPDTTHHGKSKADRGKENLHEDPGAERPAQAAPSIHSREVLSPAIGSIRAGRPRHIRRNHSATSGSPHHVTSADATATSLRTAPTRSGQERGRSPPGRRSPPAWKSPPGDLNPQPLDYKSSALPVELGGRGLKCGMAAGSGSAAAGPRARLRMAANWGSRLTSRARANRDRCSRSQPLRRVGLAPGRR
jgi:hypothetical protein